MFTDIILIRLKDDESVFELGQNLLREIWWSIQIRPPGVETMPRRPAGCQVPSFFHAMRWPGKGGNTMARIAE